MDNIALFQLFYFVWAYELIFSCAEQRKQKVPLSSSWYSNFPKLTLVRLEFSEVRSYIVQLKKTELCFSSCRISHLRDASNFENEGTALVNNNAYVFKTLNNKKTKF